MNEFPYQGVRPMGGTDGDPGNSVKTSNWRGNNQDICLRCGIDRNALREMLTGSRGNRVTAHTAIENCSSCKKALGGKDETN